MGSDCALFGPIASLQSLHSRAGRAATKRPQVEPERVTGDAPSVVRRPVLLRERLL
jgi:hypothetical protein